MSTSVDNNYKNAMISLWHLCPVIASSPFNNLTSVVSTSRAYFRQTLLLSPSSSFCSHLTPIRWNFLKTLYKAGLSMYDLKRRHTFCLQSHPFDETLWKPYEAWLSMYDLDRSHHVRNKCSFKPSDNAIKRVLIISRY